MVLYNCKPKIMVFFTSFRCNLKCSMCYAWVKQKDINELSLDNIRHLFKDRLISNNLEIINITGGEPTLRQDLTEIVKIILKHCSKLKKIDLSTNGVKNEEVIDQVERILSLLLPTRIKLAVSISVDGVGAMHEKVRGVKDIFSGIEKTIMDLKDLLRLYPYLSLGLNMTVHKLNYDQMERVWEFAKGKGLGLSFTLAALSDIGVESFKMQDKFILNREEKNKIILSIRDLSKKGAIEERYARFLLSWLIKGRRLGSCAFRKGKAVLLEPDGEFYLCGNYRQARLGNILTEDYKTMSKRAKKVSRYLSKRCLSCVSNCYSGS